MEQPTEKDIKGMTSIVNAIHYLKKSKEAFEDWQRQFGCNTEKIAKRQEKAINRIYFDIITTPFMRKDVISVMKDEWNSDVYEVDEIAQKSKLLPAESRATLIQLLDAMIAGETINLVEYEGNN